MATQELRLLPPERGWDQKPSWKCVYTSAHIKGNKQEEMGAIVQQENYDIVAITETWWDDSHN